ncbi:MAG: DUF3387 domain-containing protein [Lachnospiraceae bacterium]|nr:DUF3387 domain-containing protein [Lachnospiraceae bacterium]
MFPNMVIKELLEAAELIAKAHQAGAELGLTQEELAFYDALTNKRLLKKYKYPPEQYENAIDTVISQCEMWTDNVMDVQEEKGQIYNLPKQTKMLMVAEDKVIYGE